MMSSENFINYQTVETMQIYLNSKYATVKNNGTYKSDVEFNISFPLVGIHNILERKLSVVDAQIPISWYLINNNNCQFSITYDTGSTINYSFPKGNYNVSTFMKTWMYYLGSNWSVTYNSIKNHFIFSNSVNNFTIFDTVNSIFEIIGFAKGRSFASVNKVLETPYPYNFIGITKLNIRSQIFDIKNVDTFSRSTDGIITSIPIETSQSGVICYNNLSNYKSKINGIDISFIDIQLTDDEGNLIDFQNADWTITLQIDTVKEIIKNMDTFEDIIELNKTI